MTSDLGPPRETLDWAEEMLALCQSMLTRLERMDATMDRVEVLLERTITDLRAKLAMIEQMETDERKAPN